MALLGNFGSLAALPKDFYPFDMITRHICDILAIFTRYCAWLQSKNRWKLLECLLVLWPISTCHPSASKIMLHYPDHHQRVRVRQTLNTCFTQHKNLSRLTYWDDEDYSYWLSGTIPPKLSECIQDPSKVLSIPIGPFSLIILLSTGVLIDLLNLIVVSYLSIPIGPISSIVTPALINPTGFSSLILLPSSSDIGGSFSQSCYLPRAILLVWSVW